MSSKAEARAMNALQDYRNAIAANDVNKKNKASDDFHDAILGVETNRRNELMIMYGTLNSTDANKVFEEFAKVARGFSEVNDAFELGEKMANDGKNDLFFPAAAAELSKFAGTFKALKEAADTVIHEVHDLVEPFKQKDAEALVEEGMQAKDALDELLSKLHEMRNVLPA